MLREKLGMRRGEGHGQLGKNASEEKGDIDHGDRQN